MSEPYSAYPLSWPAGWKRTAREDRKAASFGKKSAQPGSSWLTTARLSVADAVSRVMHELGAFTGPGKPWRCDPSRVVISTNIPVKRDGLPYSDRREPEDVGAAVYFRLDDKPLVLACDKWNRVADNIAAIAAHVGALRGQERWGVGSVAQAFAGYVALQERTGPSCWEVLDISTDATEQQILDAYRRKAREAHPDNGGSTDQFVAVTQAKDIAIATRKGGA